MATKNTKSGNNMFNFENALDAFSLVNRIALNTTENGFVKGLTLVEKGQHYTNKTLKKGFNFSSAQQETFFNTLQAPKEKASKIINKVKSLYNKT